MSAFTILLLVLRRVMGGSAAHDHANAPPPRVDPNLSANTLTVLLCIASISCFSGILIARCEATVSASLE